MNLSQVQIRQFNRLMAAGRKVAAELRKLPADHPNAENFRRRLQKYEGMVEGLISTDAVDVFRIEVGPF